MIVDMHCHLGDILYPDGGRLIWQTGVRKEGGLDLISISEHSLHNSMGGTLALVDRYLSGLVTRAERKRNATATLENMRAAMAAAGVTYAACMPIPPHVTFDDLARAAEADPAILPFTGVDFTRQADLDAKLGDDVARGARGLKLHPIIQQRPLDGTEMMAAVEAFAPHGRPVLFHCGISSYYLGAEKTHRQNPELGRIEDARRLAKAFPGVTFIAGHAGLFKVKAVMDLLGPLDNVAVDISFQSPATIRDLLRVFGPERVLYASDWPYGNHLPAVRSVARACRGDNRLADMIYCENAARLLKLQT
jgi:predicted TIM-barrel fold metal-dependent hydrolase